jgi:hypothetical protein
MYLGARKWISPVRIALCLLLVVLLLASSVRLMGGVSYATDEVERALDIVNESDMTDWLKEGRAMKPQDVFPPEIVCTCRLTGDPVNF